MDTKFQNNSNQNVHLGHNIQRLREMMGYKQITLAEMLNLSPQSILEYEQSAEIPEDVLEKFATALGVTPDLIKNFNEEKAIYNIQSNITYEANSSNNSQAYQPVINNHPIDQVVEFLEKILQSKKEKADLLIDANKSIKDLTEQISKLKGK